MINNKEKDPISQKREVYNRNLRNRKSSTIHNLYNKVNATRTKTKETETIKTTGKKNKQGKWKCVRMKNMKGSIETAEHTKIQKPTIRYNHIIKAT